jgi:peptidoglycan glycosyltransferase
VNAPIVRLFGLVIVLFGLLVVFTSRWTVFEAEALRENTANRRTLLYEETIKRGIIRAADGKALAGSERIEGRRYRRRYPAGPLFAHSVGYSFTAIGRAGLERHYNDELTGRESELKSVLDSLLGDERIGNDLETTLHPRAQQVALEELGKRGTGGVVALDVKTGAVLVMASNPSYDPNRLDSRGELARLGQDETRRPLVNRTTQASFPPGSTMKVVTAAAALDSGRYKKDSKVSGANGKKISGVPLNNFGSQDFGDIDLTFALTNSVNTVWAEVAEKLGKDTMQDYAERFGFYDDPPLDYPDDQMIPSGVRGRRGLLRLTSDRVDVGRAAIGQGGLEATPLQMATVAQTVGNGGKRLEPYLVQRVVDPDGRTVDEREPKEAEQVISEQAAAELTEMMKNVVREGTGTAAALEGVDVAGKTGTAEIDIARRINDPWFIGFTDRFAVAVVVEKIPQGSGGTVAAPIAKAVLQSLGE